MVKVVFGPGGALCTVARIAASVAALRSEPVSPNVIRCPPAITAATPGAFVTTGTGEGGGTGRTGTAIGGGTAGTAGGVGGTTRGGLGSTGFEGTGLAGTGLVGTGLVGTGLAKAFTGGLRSVGVAGRTELPDGASLARGWSGWSARGSTVAWANAWPQNSAPHAAARKNFGGVRILRWTLAGITAKISPLTFKR